MLVDGYDVLRDIDLDLEAFTDDLVPAIIGDGGGFYITYTLEDDSIIFSWTWDLLGSEPRIKRFVVEEEESAEQFVNKIDAYLFSLCIDLANL